MGWEAEAHVIFLNFAGCEIKRICYDSYKGDGGSVKSTNIPKDAKSIVLCFSSEYSSCDCYKSDESDESDEEMDDNCDLESDDFKEKYKFNESEMNTLYNIFWNEKFKVKIDELEPRAIEPEDNFETLPVMECRSCGFIVRGASVSDNLISKHPLSSHQCKNIAVYKAEQNGFSCERDWRGDHVFFCQKCEVINSADLNLTTEDDTVLKQHKETCPFLKSKCMSTDNMINA